MEKKGARLAPANVFDGVWLVVWLSRRLDVGKSRVIRQASSPSPVGSADDEAPVSC